MNERGEKMSEKIEKIRNGEMTEGIINAGNRVLLYALGIDTEEIHKPFIGIVNSWNEMHPGHKHLRELAAAVKEGVIAAGGQPLNLIPLRSAMGRRRDTKECALCFPPAI